jgi:hypothetical protein
MSDMPSTPPNPVTTEYKRPEIKQAHPFVGILLGLLLGMVLAAGAVAVGLNNEVPAKDNIAQLILDEHPCGPGVIVGRQLGQGVVFQVNAGPPSVAPTAKDLIYKARQELTDVSVARDGEFLVIVGFACPEERTNV